MCEAVRRMMKEYIGKPKRKFIRCTLGIDHYRECENDCKRCDNMMTRYEYPKFTAEKQIELIKLISEATIDEENTKFAITKYGNEYYFEYNILIGDCGNTYPEYSKYGDNFSEVLADLVTSLKDKLDTAKVKEILNGTL